MPLRQHTSGLNTLHVSKMDVKSSLRWICCKGIIFTLQVTHNSKIEGNLGLCNGVRVHSYALETAYQYLKHLFYVKYGCEKQSEVDISLNHHLMALFSLHKLPKNPKILAFLGGGNEFMSTKG